MPERDALPEVGQLRNVFVDVVVKRKLSLLRQEKDGGCRELLRHGCYVEDSGRSNGHVIIEIGHTVATLVDDLTILIDTQCTTRRTRLIPLIEDLIHLLGKVSWQILRTSQ